MSRTRCRRGVEFGRELITYCRLPAGSPLQPPARSASSNCPASPSASARAPLRKAERTFVFHPVVLHALIEPSLRIQLCEPVVLPLTTARASTPTSAAPAASTVTLRSILRPRTVAPEAPATGSATCGVPASSAESPSPGVSSHLNIRRILIAISEASVALLGRARLWQ